jgi:hypothetical protein
VRLAKNNRVSKGLMGNVFEWKNGKFERALRVSSSVYNLQPD